MTTYLLLALLAIAILAGAIQSYRLGWYMESAKQYKSRLQAEELRTQSHRESTAWWRSKANWLLQLKQEADMWRNWSRMEVLNERPTLHAKKLRRILNAHYKRQAVKPARRNEKVRTASLLYSCMEVMEGGFTSKEQAASGKHAVREALKQVRAYNTRPRITRTTPFNSYAP